MASLSSRDDERDDRTAVEDFDAVFEAHYDTIRHYLARRTPRSAADDLASEVFCRAFQLRDRFDPAKGGLRQWLHGIAANVLREHTSRLQREQRFIQTGGTGTTDAAAPNPPTESLIDLRDGVQALDERDRQTLQLWLAGLTYTQVAARLAIPVGTVRSRLNRIRQILLDHVDRQP